MSVLATELEWPEGTKFFEVQCRLGIWDIDGWDADKAPEVKALGGTVRITPRTPTGRIRILEPDGKYRVVVATPLTFNIDEYTGKLVNTADNTEGVWVVDPTSDTVDPNGFTYSAVVTPKVGSPFTVEFDGSVAINGVYDLANGATVVPSKGVSALDSRIAKLEQDVGSLDVTTTTLGQEVGNLSGITTTLGQEVGNLSGIATTLDHLLVGPGRPDTPSTTGGIITGSEPVGCEYRSTDGAGVGAWTWSKRPTGWEVTNGDTGWRDVTSLASEWHEKYPDGFPILARRTDSTAMLRLGPLRTPAHGAISGNTKVFILADEVWRFLLGESSPIGGSMSGVVGRGPTNAPFAQMGRHVYTAGSFYADHNSRGTLTGPSAGVWPATLPGTPA